MALKMVKIVHDETKQEAEVLPSAVSAWELNGWTRAENESKEETTTVPPKEEKPPAAPKGSVSGADNKKE